MINIIKITEAKLIVKLELMNQTHLPYNVVVSDVLLFCCWYDGDFATKIVPLNF